MRIILKDKQNSSGTIKDGEIVLYISSRLPRREQQHHIEVLTARLTPKLERARQMALRAGLSEPPPGLTPSPVVTDDQLEAWAREINQQYYGFPMGKVRFRSQESRWGSCSGLTRNIQISRRLCGGPHELLEYVLIHEISHLKGIYPPHSRAFWDLVAIACPDWRQRRTRLRRFEEYLRSLPPNPG